MSMVKVIGETLRTAAKRSITTLFAPGFIEHLSVFSSKFPRSSLEVSSRLPYLIKPTRRQRLNAAIFDRLSSAAQRSRSRLGFDDVFVSYTRSAWTSKN